ncbi:MAG: anthranilate synthase component I family protein [Sphingobacteriia bacterium]|nr:anthranilate synthase component I family protein [Sphingobacteriia bacterium]
MKKISCSLNRVRDRFLALTLQKPHVLCLDSDSTDDPYGIYQWIGFAADLNAKTHINPQTPPDPQYWWAGGIGYEWRTTLEPTLSSQNPSPVPFPPVFFFQPEVVIYQLRNDSHIYILADSPEDWLLQLSEVIPLEPEPLSQPQKIISYPSKDKYLYNIQKIQNWIKEGEVYELNYCRYLSWKGTIAYPEKAYLHWQKKGSTPFSAYFKTPFGSWLCKSPERFLALRNQQIISQPIKGTIVRGESSEKDIDQAEKLRNSSKDRAENVMIVDLVRNDFNRVCVPGTVKVPELFGIYPFTQLYHMISTVTGQLEAGKNVWNALQAAFPPGSMTGAPKISSMDRIEEIEPAGRGLFSGTIGYLNPNGTADFNVVIRTLAIGENEVVYFTGGAITYDSIPLEEWEETETKALALQALWTP